jgi:hypothetical protein
VALRCLVPEREIVRRDHEPEEEEERRKAAADLGPVLPHRERHDRLLAHAPLPQEERNEEHTKDDEEAVHGRVRPRLRVPAPLQRDEERRRHGHTENGANPVESKPLAPANAREVFVDWGGLRLEEEGDEGDRDRADGEIDVEAPAPGDMVGEGTAHERADDGGETKDGTERAEERRALFEARNLSDDRDDRDEDPKRGCELRATIKSQM